MGSNSKDQRELAMHHAHPFFLIKDKHKPSRKRSSSSIGIKFNNNVYRGGSFSHCCVVQQSDSKKQEKENQENLTC